MAMDTPEKPRISTPLSKFEDSPVFNYINSLSPIKPVKSIHITQTFQSLSFSSLPSIFTSPHVSSHKESRFLRRHNHSDPSEPEFSSENGNKSRDKAQLYDNSSELQENFVAEVPIEEVSVQKLAIELPMRLKYDCGSPENDSTPSCGPQVDCLSKFTGMSASEVSQKGSSEDEVSLQKMYQNERKKEGMESEWENLISDAEDLLIFNSPIDKETFKGMVQKSMDPLTSSCKIDAVGSIEQRQMENHSTQPGETTEPKGINHIWDNLAVNSNQNDKADISAGTYIQLEAVSNLHRGMRRRCLDFEMVGAGSDASRRVLPGIGLHLNALAINSKDTKNVKLELSCGIRLASSIASFHSPTIAEELTKSLALDSERDTDPTEHGLPPAEDASQTSASLVTEELIHSSPKKKRRKLEGEGEVCKRCNCKKSKCLKLYCECFAAGVYCIEPCSCRDCFNKPIHEDTVLETRKQIESRNPLAFAPKVIRDSESVAEIGEESSKTPASARHKRGCNCKKSSCLKKYCECYQGGVGCSINCRCEGCKNAFGRKDGSAPTETEGEREEEEETDAAESNGIDKVTTNIEIENINNEERIPNSILPMTPLPLCSPLLQLPFSSKSKPPRSFLGIGSSSGLYTAQKYNKLNIIRAQQKFENQLQTVPDDVMPEMLTGSVTPATGIRTSPNSKRVSPPQSILGSSPGLRSGRKLILQSIPSFPSLTPQH